MGKKEPPKGAQIRVWSWFPPLWHHGVYVGNGWVIHLTGPISAVLTGDATIRKDSLKKFCNGASWEVVDHPDGCTPEKAVRRAEQSIGYKGYDVRRDNCENFARWCTSNDARSLQAAIPGLNSGRREANGKGYRRHER